MKDKKLSKEEKQEIDANKSVFERAMDAYIKEQSRLSFIPINMVIRPCTFIFVIFTVMFVISIISSTQGIADMKITQLHDFINQTSAATLTFQAMEGAFVFFNLNERMSYKTLPLQVINDSELNADIIYTTDTENVDMISKDFLTRIEQIEDYLQKDIIIKDSKGVTFSYWKLICLRDSVEETV